jgi:hypothetical protein
MDCLVFQGEFLLDNIVDKDRKYTFERELEVSGVITLLVIVETLLSSNSI